MRVTSNIGALRGLAKLDTSLSMTISMEPISHSGDEYWKESQDDPRNIEAEIDQVATSQRTVVKDWHDAKVMWKVE